ncbi:MAG TPA: hypothetical protein PLV11_00785 [Phycicoccus elongatus]|jgi:hypothetical protein|nr:hypothetical protein [Phycicoccus elongatus]
MAHRFRFATTWRAPAGTATLFDTLADVDAYAAWWPEVCGVARLSADAGRVSIRSVLPWTLDLVITRTVEDRPSGILRVDLAGDLAGWAQWVVRDGRADYDQACDVRTPVLRRLPRALDPLMRWNHAAMMRSGEAGLRRHLAGHEGS